MSRSYTPGLKILSRTKIVINRLLPMKGTIHYKVGDLVKDHIEESKREHRKEQERIGTEEYK